MLNGSGNEEEKEHIQNPAGFFKSIYCEPERSAANTYLFLASSSSVKKARAEKGRSEGRERKPIVLAWAYILLFTARINSVATRQNR